MKTKIYKFVLAALCCLLAATTVKAESIDLKELRYGYENHLVASNGETRYRFRLEFPMLVIIHQAKSLADSTSLSLFYRNENNPVYSPIAESKDKSRAASTAYLWRESSFYQQVINDTLALKPSQGFMCLALNAGEYEVASRTDVPYLAAGCSGELRTNIYAITANATQSDPVLVPLDKDGTYCWSADSQRSGTLFYQIDLGATDRQQVRIEPYGATTSPQLAVLDSKLRPVAEPDANGIIQDSLRAGRYLVRMQRDAGDCHSGIKVTWDEPEGNSFEHPIEWGVLECPDHCEKEIRKSDMVDIRYFTDTYGEKEKELIFSFTLGNNAIFDVDLAYYSTAGKRGFITLLNERREVVNQVSSFNGYSLMMLDRFLVPGKYYLIFEAGENTVGHLSYQVLFWLNPPIVEPEEPETSQPEGSETPDTPENYLPSAGLNYIRTITPTMADNRIDTFSYLKNAEHRIWYYDELGRPVQMVSYKASPNRNDYALYQEYDPLGRDGKQWLPVVRQDKAAGTYMSSETIVSGAEEQYQDACAYSYNVYEDSPLNRIMERYGAGEKWQQSGHSIKSEYRINKTEDYCLDFSVTGERENPELSLEGRFAVGELEVTVTEDEDGHSLFEFTNKDGHIVLQRSLAENDTLDTYYVYDDYGNTCFVIPPAASEALLQLSKIGNSFSEIMDKYVYQYRYDYRNRCIGKKTPQCDWVEIIYDFNDRLLFSRDGEQKKRNEWNFYFTDLLDRGVLSGLYHGTPDIQKCNSRNVYVTFKTENTSVYSSAGEYLLYGYALHNFEGISPDSLEVLKANYYDTYEYKNHLSGFDDSLNYVSDESYGKQYVNSEATPQHCKDLLTGSIVRALENKQNLYSCFYYDYNRNLIQIRHTTVNGKTAVTKSAFNFTGQPTVYCEEYEDNIRLEKRYKYDHFQRLTEEIHVVGKDTTRFVYSFDETGRIKSLTHISHNDSLTTAYSYNIRNWLTNINNPLFKQTLHYTEGTGTPYYNGNISSMTWQTDSLTTRGYEFTYDEASRLKNAVYGEEMNLSVHRNRFNEQVAAYDKMGNILELKRYGQTSKDSYGMIDDLSLTYDGNQLSAVSDNVTSRVNNDSFDFKDGAKEVIEYFYDSNGNLIQDLNKNIVCIQYNCLNLPSRIEFEGGNSISFLYDANGTKLRTTHLINGVSTTTDYCDNLIYENGIAKTLLVGNGYVSLSDNKYHYFIQDHQGNNRVIADESGNIEEVNHYYPFGGTFASTSVQPYKYNGKELDRKNGLDWYDYGARHYDPVLGRWHVVDPMAEVYYVLSPYNYCGNNPINGIDPDGMDYWSTNDPNEIARLIATICSIPNARGSIIESFNFSSWNHSTDSEFLSDLTFNDETNTFYSSYGTVENGIATRVGISLPALGRNNRSAWIEGAGGKWFKKASGRVENVYPEFDLFFASTKTGWNFVKSMISSMFRPFSTTNTFDASKSGFAQGGSANKEKMGKAKRNMSANHDVQNAQIDNLCTKYNLDKPHRRILHELIGGQGYSYHEIEQLIKDYFNK